jgi:acyl carrier protein
MFDQLKDLMVNRLKLTAELLVPEATLDEADVDSLSVVELSMLLESEMHVNISDEEILNASNIGEIARLMTERGAKV